jgi:hypothetical protein
VDRVTKSYLDAFRAEQSLGKLSDSDVFEMLAAYCVVSDTYDDEFDVPDIIVAGGNDLGLDGIAIIVNGALVGSVEEVQDLLAVNGTLDVTFIFIQAKTASNFSSQDISTFIDGVDEFFADEPTLPTNDAVESSRSIMQEIYNNSVKFRKNKPYCQLNFVTTGQWANDPHLVALIKKRVDQLRGRGLFSEVLLSPIGADELHDSYQRSKNSVTSEFVFANRVLLPDISGVKESYLGTLPAPEFLRLITDGTGNIRKSLFYDNVRDFQDYNAVNREIQDTLQDHRARGRFAVLNNGITVVARQLQTTGNKFAVTDYQIVNGCQTSHVLFDEKENLDETIHVPLKVIATDDEELTSSIITATNRQTQVSADDLYALGAFQKRLEAFLAAYPDKKKLYYERRSKQYNSTPGVEKVRIITKQQQIRSFAAMFLDEAHRASRYYADLQSQVGDKIFNEHHKLDPYYVAAYASYKLEFLFRNSGLPVYYKPGRYHLLMALRYIVGGPGMSALTANRVHGYCIKICDVLWDDTKALEGFKQGIEAIDIAMAGSPLTRDSVKTQSFTDAVRSALGVPAKGVANAAT